MMEKKYPKDLFIMGFFLSLIRHFYLLLPGIILCIVGIWDNVVLIIGLSFIILDIILSLYEQFRNQIVLKNSNNPQMAPFREAILSEDWRKNLKDLVESRIHDDESHRIDNIED